MEKKGLCSTCVNAGSCIFVKEPPVWSCEEFSCGNSGPTRARQVKRTVREEVTESE